MCKKSIQKNGLVKGAKEKAKLLYLYDMVALVEEHDVPLGLVLNLDQAPLKYIPAARKSLAKVQNKCRSPHHPIKKVLHELLALLYQVFFLPMQLTYGGKTKQALPRLKFPESFPLSANPEYFSNNGESVKVIKEIVLPYIKKQRLE